MTLHVIRQNTLISFTLVEALWQGKVQALLFIVKPFTHKHTKTHTHIHTDTSAFMHRWTNTHKHWKSRITCIHLGTHKGPHTHIHRGFYWRAAVQTACHKISCTDRVRAPWPRRYSLSLLFYFLPDCARIKTLCASYYIPSNFIFSLLLQSVQKNTRIFENMLTFFEQCTLCVILMSLCYARHFTNYWYSPPAHIQGAARKLCCWTQLLHLSLLVRFVCVALCCICMAVLSFRWKASKKKKHFNWHN